MQFNNLILIFTLENKGLQVILKYDIKYSVLQLWWNWYTRKFEGLMNIRSCKFKSCQLHQFKQ